MDDLDLHLALEALRTNPAAHAYHERITRGMQAIAQGTLTPFERDALHRLLARFPVSTPPSPDPIAALIAAFQRELPQHDPAAVATAIQQALAQQPATLNGAPVTIRMDGDTHAHQANLAIGNQVGGNLVQVTVTIPIPDARFDALLSSALRTHEHEKTLARIRHAAQQIESDRLLTLRLQGFVGRVTELAAIRERIAMMRPTGGYVLIKAAAGEGKSSSIAKLIQEAGITQTPHHFIALTTGREYQLGLLRAVVSQLILKHGLTVSYFPEESYPAMKGEFARILDELSKQGIEETIYLDGLDQLQPEIDGSRDLSFLPPQPPPGIVMVLGSRPDETLKPLEILHRVDYDLPPLSESDALVLWRSVQPGVADSLLHDLYTALKGNALFVHLAADTIQGQSLSDAASLIRQIEQNPQNLFGITLERIKRVPQSKWDTVWKPMLALLLVAQEPLRLDVLGDLLAHDHDTMQDAVWVLGGLVSQVIDQRVTLHHLLFRDYLAASVFNAREVKRWQQRLADWCAIDLDSIWADHPDVVEQARRIYARYHYVTHLFFAENWPMLWQILDAGDYGEHKTRFDPSTRLYALDLDRGRESAINAGNSTEEHIQNLPRLWKYSLLRTSLTSRVDQWPDDLFEVLAMLGRTDEILRRIELCSNVKRQIQLFTKVIQWCSESQQTALIYQIKQKLLHIEDLIYINLCCNFINMMTTINNTTIRDELIDKINNSIKLLDDPINISESYIYIAKVYINMNKLDHAKLILSKSYDNINIYGSKKSINVLIEIINLYILIKDINQAESLLSFFYKNIRKFTEKDNYIDNLLTIANLYADINNKLKSHIILYEIYSIKIDDTKKYIETITYMAKIYIQIEEPELAIKLTNEAYNIAQSSNDLLIDTLLSPIAQTYAIINNINKVDEIVDTMNSLELRTHTLTIIARILKKNALEKSLSLLTKAYNIAQSEPQEEDISQIIQEIAFAYISIGEYDEAYKIASSMDDNWEKVEILISISKKYFINNNQYLSKKISIEILSIIQHITKTKRHIITLSDLTKDIYKETTIDITRRIIPDHIRQRSNTLNFIINNCIDNNEIEIATILSSISDNQWVFAKNFMNIAKYYIKNNNTYMANIFLEKSKSIAEKCGIYRYAVILIYMCDIYINTGDLFQFQLNLNKVEDIASTIPDIVERININMLITKIYISIKNIIFPNIIIHKSIELTNYINDSIKKIESLILIANTCYDSKSFIYPSNILIKATNITKEIRSDEKRDYLYMCILNSYINIGYIDKAKELMINIETLQFNLSSHQSITKYYLDQNEFNNAINFTNSIQDIKIKKSCLDIISYRYSEKGSFLEAEEIINSINSQQGYINHLFIKTRYYINQGDLNLAFDTIHKARSINFEIAIKDNISNFLKLSQFYTELGQLGEAYIILNEAFTITELSKSWNRSKMIVEIVKGYIFINDLPKAIENAYLIDKEEDRAEALEQCIDKYIESNNLIEAAKIISICWRSCKTLYDLWIMLRLITPLLRGNTYLGNAVVEDEKWVNAQLKRLG